MVYRTEHELYHKAILFLYRYILQKYFNIVPICCQLTEEDDFVECEDFIIYGGNNNNLFEILNKTGKKIFIILGNTNFEITNSIFSEIVKLVFAKKENIINCAPLIKRERWMTLDYGKYKIWQAKHKRIILYPEKQDIYGYTFIVDNDDDKYVRKSQSCIEEGNVICEGTYKRSEHELINSKVLNLDLISNDGHIELLQLKPAGIGYKVFKRMVPE